MRSKEQHLVDICYELVLTITDKRHAKIFSEKPIEERAKWVTDQLRGCGFPTHPCGSTWGVLDK